WTWLVDKALEHGVAALLFRGLTEVASGEVPPEISGAAAVFLLSQREQNQKLAVELVRILAALKERGVAAMPFKGPLLAETVYGDIGLRSFGDLDFLIHERDVANCLYVLRDLDYNLEADYDVGPTRYYGQDRFYGKGTGIAIEPHWK